MAGTLSKLTVSSGTHWEAMAGYSRGVRVGNHIYISGTTAVDQDGRLVGGTDAAAQAEFIFTKIGAALAALGSRLEDVVRTRVFVQRIADWEAVARVHGATFGQIRPANTLVEARLVGEEYLVEIEVEAIVGAGDAT